MKRISVGFKGGQVLALRVTDTALGGLYDALGGGGWHEIHGEDGPVRVNLDQVIYVGAEGGEPRVGFG
jgi:hypothetical protein